MSGLQPSDLSLSHEEKAGALGEKGENFYGYDPHGRSFDCASCDEAARGSAQDDSFVVDQILRSRLYVDTA